MNINGLLHSLLTQGMPLNDTPASAATDSDAQRHFASLLNPEEAIASPASLIKVEAGVAEQLVGTDITAKFAGLSTQAINKLVNMT